MIICSYSHRYIVNNLSEKIVTNYLKNLETVTKVESVEAEAVKYLVQHGHKYFQDCIFALNLMIFTRSLKKTICRRVILYMSNRGYDNSIREIFI